MIEQLRNDINNIRHRLSVKFILMSYIGCSIFNIFFGTYKELGLIFVAILTFMWAINNTEKEYDKIRDRINLYRKTNDSFVIDGLISLRASVLFVVSFIAFLSIQLMLCPPSAIGAYVAYFLYLTIVMIAINGEYNPLALDGQKEQAKDFKMPHEEYRFREYATEYRRTEPLWPRFTPGSPEYMPPKSL